MSQCPRQESDQLPRPTPVPPALTPIPSLPALTPIPLSPPIPALMPSAFPLPAPVPPPPISALMPPELPVAASLPTPTLSPPELLVAAFCPTPALMPPEFGSAPPMTPMLRPPEAEAAAPGAAAVPDAPAPDAGAVAEDAGEAPDIDERPSMHPFSTSHCSCCVDSSRAGMSQMPLAKAGAVKPPTPIKAAQPDMNMRRMDISSRLFPPDQWVAAGLVSERSSENVTCP